MADEVVALVGVPNALGTGTVKTGTTVSFASTAAVPTNGLVVVCAAGFPVSALANAVSFGGITFTRQVSQAGTTSYGAIFTGLNAGAQIAAGTTLTVTYSAATAGAVSAFYAMGVDATTPVDTTVTAFATGSSTAPSVQMAVAPALANSLAIGWVATNGPQGDAFTQATGGWAVPPTRIGTTGGTATNNETGAGGSLVTSARLTYAPTLGTSRSWVAMVIALRPYVGPVSGTVAVTEANDSLARIPYGAKWGLIAHTAQAVSGPTNTTATAIDTTGANLIALGFTMYNGNYTVPLSVTDNLGNNYVPAGTQATNTAEIFTHLYYCLAPNVGPGHIFSVNNPNGNDTNSVLTVAAFAGLGDYAFDQGSNGPAGTTTASTGSITPTAPDELLVTGVGAGVAGSSITAITGGFTITDAISFAAGVNEGGGLAYLIQVGAAAAANPVWSTPAATRSVAKIASFKALSSVVAPATGNLAVTEANDTIAAVGGSDWVLMARTAHASPSGVTNITAAIDTTGTNFIALTFTMYGGNYTAPANITDNKGNIFLPAGAYDQVLSNELLTQIYFCPNPVVGTGHIFTYTQAGTNDTNSVLAVGAFAGPKNYNYSLDQFRNGAAGTTSCSPGSITPAIDKELLILAAGSGVAGSSFGAVDSGFTIANAINFTSGSNEGGAMAYLSQGQVAAVNPVWTIPGGTIAVAKIAAFRADQTVGTLAVTEANDTLSGAGGPRVNGTLTVTEANDALAAAGGLVVGGALAITEANDTLAATGNVPLPPRTGTLSVLEAADAISASGVVSAFPPILGTLAVTEANDALAATGNVSLSPITFGAVQIIVMA